MTQFTSDKLNEKCRGYSTSLHILNGQSLRCYEKIFCLTGFFKFSDPHEQKAMNPVMMRGGPGPGGYLHAANGLDQEELQALRFFKGEMSKATRIVNTIKQALFRIRNVLFVAADQS